MATEARQRQPSGRLAGKVALITGTGGGQGRVAAQTFAEHGAVVVGCDLDIGANEETKRLVHQSGGEMIATAPLDLGEPEQVTAWVDNAAKTFGRIDVLYNNAASPRFAPFAEMTLEEWDYTLRNELALVFHACKAVWPHMTAAGGGSIVNVSGYSAIDGQPAGSAAHAAAKGGVISLGRALSVEGSPHGIRVNTVIPGIVDTDVTRKMIPPARLRADQLDRQARPRRDAPGRRRLRGLPRLRRSVDPHRHRNRRRRRQRPLRSPTRTHATQLTLVRGRSSRRLL